MIFSNEELKWIENNRKLIDSGDFYKILETLGDSKLSDMQFNRLAVILGYITGNQGKFKLVIHRPDPSSSDDNHGYRLEGPNFKPGVARHWAFVIRHYFPVDSKTTVSDQDLKSLAGSSLKTYFSQYFRLPLDFSNNYISTLIMEVK